MWLLVSDITLSGLVSGLMKKIIGRSCAGTTICIITNSSRKMTENSVVEIGIERSRWSRSSSEGILETQNVKGTGVDEQDFVFQQ